MYVPNIELHETTSLIEAAKLFRQFAPDARFLAGGTDLLVDLKAGRVATKHLISLNQIDELRGVSITDEGLKIGALTTITKLGRSPLVRERFSPILDATTRMAAPPVRNVATVGGNIISAVPCADLPPILIALGAEVLIGSPEGERVIPLESIFAGPRRTVLGDGELLKAVRVPFMQPGFGAAYERFGLREGNAIAVASVAIGLKLDDDDIVTAARVVLGAVAPLPMVCEEAESLLVGRPANEQSFADVSVAAREAARPISDVRGTAEFRRELVEVLTGRALGTAHQRAKGSIS